MSYNGDHLAYSIGEKKKKKKKKKKPWRTIQRAFLQNLRLNCPVLSENN